MIKTRILKIIDITLFGFTVLMLAAFIINNGFYLEEDVSAFLYQCSYILIILFIIDNILYLILAKNKITTLKSRKIVYVFILIMIVQFILIQLNLYSVIFRYDNKTYYFHILNQVFIFLIFFIKFSKSNYSRIMHTRLNPFQIFVLSFILLILIGALLLYMPKSSIGKESIRFIDALFTSTSAVCVTGLTVVDTPITFTLSGRIIILILIQFGGLGITTFTAFFSLLFFNGISITERFMIGRIISDDTIPDIPGLIKTIIITTIMIELAGALLLFLAWYRFFPTIESAVFHSVFHAVSAFCNAGFSTLSNSLERFAGDIAVNLIISVLIFLGGIGFIVMYNIYQHFFSPRKKIINTHTKIVLSVSILLIVTGTIVMFLFECNKSMKDLPFLTKLLVSFFHSVSSRTAGFNTFPVSSLSVPVAFVLMLFMFIGASPNSTSGGIKTTTFGILMGTLVATFKGSDVVELFKRRIPKEIVFRAISLAVISTLYIFIVFVILLSLESIPPANLLFEIISAFGTVGLSRGITSSLGDISKVFIILTMFTGRIGPITLTLSLISFKKVLRTRNPEENNILVG